MCTTSQYPNTHEFPWRISLNLDQNTCKNLLAALLNTLRLRITVDKVGEIRSKEEADNNGDERNPAANVTSQYIEEILRQVQGDVGDQQSGEQVCPPVCPVQYQQISATKEKTIFLSVVDAKMWTLDLVLNENLRSSWICKRYR